MACDVNYTDEFEEWWDDLTIDEQRDVTACVGLLEELGVKLKFPQTSNVESSRHGGMRELRIQSKGKPYRVFYAFDPRREAVLLIGAVKLDGRFYDEYVPIADKLFDNYLIELKNEES